LLPSKKHETDIEQIMRQELERRGLKFEQEFPTRTGFIIDFAFPSLKVAIECDGEKWHSSKRARKKDRFKDYMLKREGWTIYRFTGSEIMSDISECIDKIKFRLVSLS